MINSIFILNAGGEVIIEKHYRGNTRREEADLFWARVLQCTTPEDLAPVLSTSRSVLIHVHRNGLYLLASVHNDVPPLVVVEFLLRMADIFADYFGELNEHAIKDNFITLYELLDEMLDNGVPFTMEPNVLMEMIPQPSMLNKMIESVTGESSYKSQLPSGTLSIVPWRRKGVKYTQNEVFVDINEEISGIISENGSYVQMQISGSIMCNSRLSGWPDLTLVLKGAQNVMDDTALHPSVRLFRYANEGVFSFVPPDGTFRLLTYTVTNDVTSRTSIPTLCQPTILFDAHARTGNVRVTLSPNYTPNFSDGSVEDCQVVIPFPKEVASATFNANMGSVYFDTGRARCVWNVGKIEHSRTATMFGSVSFAAHAVVPKHTPSVILQFKTISHSLTGIGVDSLTVHGEQYKPYKGLRLTSRSRKLEYRTCAPP